MAGEPRPGYRQEPKVKPDSNVETYVALKLLIDNWRWSGVPFLPAHGQESAAERQRGARPVSAHAERAVRRPVRAEAGSQRAHPAPAARRRHLAAVQRQSARDECRQCGRCACTSATTPSSAPTRPRPTNGCCSKRWPATPRSSSGATKWRRPGRSWMAFGKAWDGKPLSNREFYAAGTWGPAAADDLLAQGGHVWREPLVVR